MTSHTLLSPPPAYENRASAYGEGMPNAELDTLNTVWTLKPPGAMNGKYFHGFKIVNRRSHIEVCVYLSQGLELPNYYLYNTSAVSGFDYLAPLNAPHYISPLLLN